nr:iron ABC transporter permease [Rhizobium halophytocola]
MLVIAALLTLVLGVRDAAVADIFRAFLAFDPQNPVHIVIRSIRVPRLVAGIIAGASLGMAGTVMQALTRNPLAEPGLLGVNSGAAFAVVFGALLFGQSDASFVSLLAFPGAGLAALSVFVLGGGLRGDAGPVRLTLAGIALNALLLSLVSALVLWRSDSLDVYRFWVVGSLAEAAGRPLAGMAALACAGAAVAILAAPRIEALTLGGALARGLGTQPGRVQLAALAAVTLLTGSAVSVAGPVAFVGLMVPSIIRRFRGHHLRADLFASGLLGAVIVLLADTAGRLVLAPQEIRIGVMTGLVGAPVFILIARRLRPGATA